MSAAGSNALGNYVFVPGAGGNTYIIPPGAGRTVILPNSNVLLLETSNKVQFAAGYGSFKPTLSVGSLDIHFASGGELIIEGFDPNNAQRNPGIDTFEFTDRTFTYNQFLALGFDVQATGSDQEVNGTSVTDRLVGTQGNDTLNGGAGNDTLTGGPGDVLVGGGGDEIPHMSGSATEPKRSKIQRCRPRGQSGSNLVPALPKAI